MMPSTLPNGSITDAVTKPVSPRGVIGWYSLAPIDSSFSNVAAMSSTCQCMIAPPGPAVAPAGSQSRWISPSSSWESPMRNSA